MKHPTKNASSVDDLIRSTFLLTEPRGIFFELSGKSGKSQGKKTGLEIREKSGNPVSSQGKVREFRRWSGKNIKSLYTNKLTAAAPSPSLQTTRRMKQAFLLFYICHPVSLNTAFFHPLIAKNPEDCVEKSQGKMKNLVWKSGKSQGISLLDSCSNPDQ
ncbi:hypothetical protein J6590_035372 [Homalodisca vitripennis]|nr:hypothetical protein J6590_035372 [Homalodisca vitripennis]